MSKEPLTSLLSAWSRGDRGAHDELFERLYPALHKIAGRQLGTVHGPLTLDTVDLVHESYLRLIDQRTANWRNRQQFFSLAARVVRRVLLDHLRRRSRLKRGRGVEDVPISDVTIAMDGDVVDFLILDQALDQLEAIDRQAVRVVELRFFTGLDHDETAQALGIGRATVARKWRFARAFLRRNFDLADDGGSWS